MKYLHYLTPFIILNHIITSGKILDSNGEYLSHIRFHHFEIKENPQLNTRPFEVNFRPDLLFKILAHFNFDPEKVKNSPHPNQPIKHVDIQFSIVLILLINRHDRNAKGPAPEDFFFYYKTQNQGNDHTFDKTLDCLAQKNKVIYIKGLKHSIKMQWDSGSKKLSVLDKNQLKNATSFNFYSLYPLFEIKSDLRPNYSLPFAQDAVPSKLDFEWTVDESTETEISEIPKRLNLYLKNFSFEFKRTNGPSEPVKIKHEVKFGEFFNIPQSDFGKFAKDELQAKDNFEENYLKADGLGKTYFEGPFEDYKKSIEEGIGYFEGYKKENDDLISLTEPGKGNTIKEDIEKKKQQLKTNVNTIKSLKTELDELKKAKNKNEVLKSNLQTKNDEEDKKAASLRKEKDALTEEVRRLKEENSAEILSFEDKERIRVENEESEKKLEQESQKITNEMRELKEKEKDLEKKKKVFLWTALIVLSCLAIFVAGFAYLLNIYRRKVRLYQIRTKKCQGNEKNLQEKREKKTNRGN